MDESKGFPLYAVFKKDRKGRIVNFSYGSKLDRVRGALLSSPIDEAKPVAIASKAQLSGQANLGEALKRMIGAIQGQSELVSIIPMVNVTFSRRVWSKVLLIP